MSNYTDLLLTIAALSVVVTSTGILISRHWRWSIALLAIQYVGIAVLTASSWPIEMAIAKMVAGWMSGAVLGMAVANVPSGWGEEGKFWPSGSVFRLLAAFMVIIAVYAALPIISDLIPSLPNQITLGGLALIGLGLLHLGLTAQPLRISIGLLTMLAGFEIIYASVEFSVLVAGLLAGVNLGLGLVGAYMITAAELEQEYE
jgi:hypothetical protein